SPDADRNLLFGVLALQAGVINKDQFAQGCAAWAADKEKPLADLLVERGWLTADARQYAESLLELALQKHGGDVQESLADAVAEDTELRPALVGLSPSRPG